MKQIHLLFALALFIVSCTQPKEQLTKQEVAEENVRLYLFKNINDTTSYQSVEFDSLKRRETIYGYVPEIMREPDTLIKTDEDIERENQERKNFKPEFLGYSIDHKFRSKNGLGATVISNFHFVLDTNLNVIRHNQN